MIKEQKISLIQNENESLRDGWIDILFEEEPWNNIVIDIDKLSEQFFNNHKEIYDLKLLTSLFTVVLLESLWKGYNVIICMKEEDLYLEYKVNEIIKDFKNTKRIIELVVLKD